MVGVYFDYRKSQFISKNRAYNFSELMRTIEILCSQKVYQIVISRNLAYEILYFLVRILPGIHFILIDYDPDLGDAEANFGQLAKGSAHFYSSRIKYIRDYKRVEDLFNQQNFDWIKGSSPLAILEEKNLKADNFIREKVHKTLFRSKNLGIYRLNNTFQQPSISNFKKTTQLKKYRYPVYLGIELVASFACVYVFILFNLKKLLRNLISKIGV